MRRRAQRPTRKQHLTVKCGGCLEVPTPRHPLMKTGAIGHPERIHGRRVSGVEVKCLRCGYTFFTTHPDVATDHPKHRRERSVPKAAIALAWLMLAAGCVGGHPFDPDAEECFDLTIYMTFDPNAHVPIATDSTVVEDCGR